MQPDQNPFADLMANLQQQRMEQMASQQEPTAPAPPANAGTNNEAPQPITAPGVANQTTQSLISALRELNNFIKASQTHSDIQTAQVIISLLSQLIQKDRTAQDNIQQAG